MKSRRALLLTLMVLPWALLVLLLAFHFRTSKAPPDDTSSTSTAVVPAGKTAVASSGSGASATSVHAHNLLLRKGPTFRVYVRWLNGELKRTRRNEDPTFDDIESFYLFIKTGVLRANIGDIGNFLNTGGLANSPLKNVVLRGDGDHIKLTGTLHKIIPLPVELDASISALPDGRIRLRVNSIKALKVPLKGLLREFHVTLADLVHAGSVPGLEVTGSDILLDTQTLLPPPHIRGQLTLVHVVNPDLELVYGDAAKEVERVEQWRNFLHLQGGTLDFGKLTMHQLDLIMIDTSKDAWFDLDLEHYQQQLIHGYTRVTPDAALQIFMPDLRDLPPDKQPQNVNIQWYKNRNVAPPSEVIKQQGK